MFLISNLKGQDLSVKFESNQSKVVEDKKTKKIKHYIPIILKGKLTSDITLKAEINKSGTANIKICKLVKSEIDFKVKESKKDKIKEYKGIIEIEIEYDENKLKGQETIVIKLTTESDRVKIEKPFHTVFIQYEGLHNYLTTSIGTNFDYLNGGAQAKKLYWDVIYFNPSINNTNYYLRTGIYQNRNFSIDSTGNTRNPFNYNFIERRQDQNPGTNNPIDTSFFQRQTYNIKKDQLTSDNYAFFSDIGLRLNPLSAQSNFYLGAYSEIILRKYNRSTEGELLMTDTFNIIAPRGDTIGPFLGTKIGVSNWSALDLYYGINFTFHHISDNFEFQFSPGVIWGRYNVRSNQNAKGRAGIIKLMIRERNSGIKLGFEYRSAGSTNDIFLVNLSKTFSVSKSDLFKKI